jgi:hypothetical protein
LLARPSIHARLSAFPATNHTSQRVIGLLGRLAVIEAKTDRMEEELLEIRMRLANSEWEIQRLKDTAAGYMQSGNASCRSISEKIIVVERYRLTGTITKRGQFGCPWCRFAQRCGNVPGFETDRSLCVQGHLWHQGYSTYIRI